MVWDPPLFLHPFCSFLSSWWQLPSPISSGKHDRGCGKLALMPLPSRVPWPACGPDPSLEPHACITSLHLNISVYMSCRHLKMFKPKACSESNSSLPTCSSVFISENGTIINPVAQARNLNILPLTPSSHSLPTSDQPQNPPSQISPNPLTSVHHSPPPLSQPPSPLLG